MPKPNTQYVFVYDDKRYNIVDIHFNIAQKQEDKSGKPVTFPRHSPILLYLTPMGKNKDRELIKLYATKQLFSGHIEFLIIEDGIENRIMRHLEFANAKLSRVGLSTQYQGHEGKEILRIEISPYIIKHGDTIMEWANNPSNPFKERNTQVLSRADFEEEPKIQSHHIEDEQGNTISINSIDIGDKIKIVVESSRKALGETFEFDLSSSKVDYEYNGKRLPNDILTVRVNDQNMSISLTAIAPEK